MRINRWNRIEEISQGALKQPSAERSAYLAQVSGDDKELLSEIESLLACDSLGLSSRQRVELFRSAFSAVHYAHQKLVIHRDIKPSNVLVQTATAPTRRPVRFRRCQQAGISLATRRRR